MENGEPLASLWRMSLCGRLGPVFPSSAVQTGRYPGTRKSVDPAYKVAPSGTRAAETRWKDKIVADDQEQLHPQRMMRENGEEDIDDAKVPAAQRRPVGITEICVFR